MGVDDTALLNTATMDAQLTLARIIPEADLAPEVPVPMGIPILAFLMVGASLTLFPVTAVLVSVPWRYSEIMDLWKGLTWGNMQALLTPCFCPEGTGL